MMHFIADLGGVLLCLWFVLALVLSCIAWFSVRRRTCASAPAEWRAPERLALAVAVLLVGAVLGVPLLLSH
jgi:hypothetical protein